MPFARLPRTPSEEADDLAEALALSARSTTAEASIGNSCTASTPAVPPIAAAVAAAVADTDLATAIALSANDVGRTETVCEWACTTCTFLNQMSQLQCEMCGARKPM